MKAFGPFGQALGLPMIGYSVVDPLIQKGGFPPAAAGFWFVLGLLLVSLQQAVLWNLKKEKRHDRA